MSNKPILDSAIFPERPPVETGNPLPRYAQVRNWLSRQIRSGAIASGAKLPAEKDWAPSLGVSQMTLNNAIQALVKEGLIVREVGRGTFVRSGEKVPAPGHIGLILHWQQESDGGHYGTHILQGIYHVAANRPARFGFAWGSDVGTEGTEYYVRVADAMQANGLLLVMPPAHALPHILALGEAGIPFVVAGASWKAHAVPSVDIDNAGGARMAVEHLAGLGHSRIGLINGALYLRSSHARTAAFRRALRGRNLPVEPAWEITSRGFQMDADAADRLRRLIRSRHAPTAFFAAGYYLSMQAVELLQSLGKHVPDDFSVVGFGDSFPAAYLNTPLTTIRHPIEELGARAAERLLDDIANRRVRRDTELLPVELVERRSAAPPVLIASPTSNDN